MNYHYWLPVTKRQLLYIIEGCQIDMPLVEHWATLGNNTPLIHGDGQMKRVISSLERNARDALYRGMDTNKYPPGDERRRVKVVH